MRVLLVNPPYQTLTSNIGVGHQIPLGLLMVGGALSDAGHEVRLLDAECDRLGKRDILAAIRKFEPDIVMTGHAGSTPAHPVCVSMLRTIKAFRPQLLTVYGGVYPTYHAEQILAREPAVDLIVRGEGEMAAAEVADVLQDFQRRGGPLDDVDFTGVSGVACRLSGRIVLTPNRPPIKDLDACRVGWELIDDWSRYRCFGLGRAAIVQFSRGCPHRCTYCGQHGFWVQWRHRDPVKLVDEIEWLYRTHDIRFITLADENPTTLRDTWQRFLELLAARQIPVYFFATIRATDIVRDADLLPLYRAAGILYILMGIESTDAAVLQQVNKGSTPQHDLEACRLLKQHDIFSILGHIVGFEEETWQSLRAAQTRLARYDGDWLNAMYVTPHSWTPFGTESMRRAREPDQRKWDYRHQVLGQKHLQPWQFFAWVKWTELWFHLRPKRLWAALQTPSSFRRRQLLWVFLHTGMVWLGEVLEFVSGAMRRRRPENSFAMPLQNAPLSAGTSQKNMVPVPHQRDEVLPLA
ncbi:MAG: cobalamin-dependent protein [Planctomycetia bacterium]|nr:cobalamin-dependent protein [Planctomycetia bacterium]